MKNKKKTFKVASLVTASMLSLSLFAGCVGNTANNQTISDNGKILSALNVALDGVNVNDVISVSSEENGSNYDVVVITENSVQNIVVDDSLKVTDTETIVDNSGNSDGSTIGENSSTVVDTPTTTEPSLVEKLYADALTFAEISESDIISFKIDDDEKYMGESAVEIEIKTADAKYCYTFALSDSKLLESEIKLLTSEGETTSYITEDEAIAAAVKILNTKNVEVTEFMQNVTNVVVKADKKGAVRLYKICFTYESYDYTVKLNATNGSIVKIEKEITDSEIIVRNVETAITVDEAKSTVLKFLEITESVEFKKVKLDYEDKQLVYELKLDYNNKEYEFEVSVASGEICDYDIDDDDECKKYNKGHFGDNDDDDDEDDDDDKNIQLGNGFKSEQEIRQIVAEQYGEVVINEIEVDKERGNFFYEFKFTKDNQFYEVKYNAKSGVVINEEKGNKGMHGAPANVETDQLIDVKTALDTAFKTAVVTETDARIMKAKLEYDDGVLVYEIEFKVRSIRYSFKINAQTGAIVESESNFR